MRIALVAPPMPFSGRVPIVPPVLEYLGALVQRERPDAELELVDANFSHFDPDAVDADLVGITSMTPTVTWAYRTADRLRERGVRVVLGGIHVSALPGEATRHADAVVVGEAESVIGRLLQAAESGRLEPFYLGERMALDDMPPPLIGRVRGPYRFRAVFTARGCPYRCTFCSVRRFFGDTIRYRPIGAVVEEVAAHPDRVYFNGDDNIWGGDTRRSAELFDALARGAKRHWYGFGDLAAVQRPGGDRMLAAAKDSGLFSVWAGWETDSSDSLSAYSAVPKQGRDREEAIRRIKSHGIEVVLFMVLGGRRDDLGSFDKALETAHRLGVQVHPACSRPFPARSYMRSTRLTLWTGSAGKGTRVRMPCSTTPIRT